MLRYYAHPVDEPTKESSSRAISCGFASYQLTDLDHQVQACRSFAASTNPKRHLFCLRHTCAWKRDGRNSKRTVRENRSGPRVAQTSSELCAEVRQDSRRRSDPTLLREVRRHSDYG